MQQIMFEKYMFRMIESLIFDAHDKYYHLTVY